MIVLIGAALFVLFVASAMFLFGAQLFNVNTLKFEPDNPIGDNGEPMTFDDWFGQIA